MIYKWLSISLAEPSNGMNTVLCPSILASILQYRNPWTAEVVSEGSGSQIAEVDCWREEAILTAEVKFRGYLQHLSVSDDSITDTVYSKQNSRTQAKSTWEKQWNNTSNEKSCSNFNASYQQHFHLVWQVHFKARWQCVSHASWNQIHLQYKCGTLHKL